MIHDNSLAAYAVEETKLNRREQLVYDWILEHGPHTDREIARGMGYGQDMNAVRPRITSLIDKNKLMEVCNRKCPVTNRRVRVVDISRPRGQFSLPLESSGMPRARLQVNASPYGEP
jgi:hypothetical protein